MIIPEIQKIIDAVIYDDSLSTELKVARLQEIVVEIKLVFDYALKILKPDVHTCECGFSGTLDECKKKFFDNGLWSALCGRRGFEYFCPKCGKLIKRRITVMN